MSSQNKIILIGTPTEDPNVKVSTNGHPMASFRLAVDRPTSPGGHTVQDHISVVAWREAAETAEHCKKGQLVLVEGRIQTRSYENNEGQRRYVTEIDARTVRPVSQGSSDTASQKVDSQTSELPQYNFGDPSPKTEVNEPQETLPSSLEEKPVEAATTSAFDFNTPFTEETTSTENDTDSSSENVPF